MLGKEGEAEPLLLLLFKGNLKRISIVDKVYFLKVSML